MPTFVNPEKCDGCKALDRPACHYICPNDLMALDPQIGKSYNREPDLCWECYSCVKVCPQSAIDMRGYADVVPLGGSLAPMRGTDSIMWVVRYRDGKAKRFKFPIRTTPWGSVEAAAYATAPATAQDIKGQLLCGEPKWLMIANLPTPKQ